MKAKDLIDRMIEGYNAFLDEDKLQFSIKETCDENNEVILTLILHNGRYRIFKTDYYIVDVCEETREECILRFIEGIALNGITQELEVIKNCGLLNTKGDPLGTLYPEEL